MRITSSTSWKRLQTIATGIVGGSLGGLLVGAIVIVLTGDHVLRRDDFVHPLHYERTSVRYATTTLLTFAVVFTFAGPVIAVASAGSWMRHAAYGLVSGVGIVVAVALIAAALENEQPFHTNKGSRSTSIDIARNYALPAALVIGPCAGILIGGSKRDEGSNGRFEHSDCEKGERDG